MFRNYSLADTFEVKGHWWLPRKKPRKVAGTLKYTPERITLELHGTLKAPSISKLGKLQDDFERCTIIHGDTSEGRCTLLNGAVIGSTHSSSGAATSELNVGLVAFGCHAPGPTLNVKSIWFDCTHLGEFVGASSIAVTNKPQRDKRVLTTVKCLPPKTVVWKTSDSTIRLLSYQSESGTRTKITLGVHHEIEVKPKKAQSLRWHLDRVGRICQLLSLLIDESVRPENVKVTLDVDSDRHPIYYLRTGRDPTRRPPALLLFYLGHILNDFGTILDTWLSASPVLLDSIGLFMEGREFGGLNLNNHFVILCQALEVFSRATTSAKYMAEADYATVKAALEAAIPSGVSADHKASLKSRINYGDEFSLRKRVKELILTLEADTVKCVCKSAKSFEDGLANTRNYLTHYTDELRPRALSGSDLYWASERAAMLIRILLLKHLGIPEATIRKHIGEHSRLMQYMHLYHGRKEN
jgi:hypothetical protein